MADLTQSKHLNQLEKIYFFPHNQLLSAAQMQIMRLASHVSKTDA